MFKRLLCYLKAIPMFIKTGEFVPHVFSSEYIPTIIIATNTSFRVSDNYQHKPNESVYKNACLIKNTCIHCGCVVMNSWHRDFETAKEELESDTAHYYYY